MLFPRAKVSGADQPGINGGWLDPEYLCADHRLRLAFLSQSADLYGSNRVLLQDLEALAGLGVESRVLVPDDAVFDEAHLVDLEKAGAETVRTDLHVLRRADGVRALRLPVTAPPHLADVDVVVPYTLAMAHYAPMLRLRGRRVVTSVHEIIDGRVGRALAMAAGLSNHVMVNSIATAEWMRASGVRRRPLTLAYPCHPPLDADRSAAPDAAGELRLLQAARINAWKGQDLVIEAVRMAHARGVPVKLSIVGGAFSGQEGLVAELKDEIADVDFITYEGEVTDISPLLKRSHALVIGSTKPEPFGLVALEAWAAGRRTIAPDEGGAAEAVRLVEGVRYRPRDAADLAKAFQRVSEDPALRGPPPADAPAAEACSIEARAEAWRAIFARQELSL